MYYKQIIGLCITISRIVKYNYAWKNKNIFLNKSNFIYSSQSYEWPRSSAFPVRRFIELASSIRNKSPSKSMSFITEVICSCIFTDVQMRNYYCPNRLLTYFCLMMRQMFSIGDRSGLQEGQFSTQILLLQNHTVCNSSSMWFCIVLLKYNVVWRGGIWLL